MDFLARREHSFFELSQKLVKKFPEVDQALLLEVLGVLRSENLQSDDRFTESYVRYRRSKGFGLLHIKADLLQRKVSEAIIIQYLQEDDAWDEMVGRLIAKKLKSSSKLTYGSKEHRRLVNFLTSRGFASEQIRKGLAAWLV